MNSTLIEKRVTSGFPVSIGTALALESMFEPVQKPYDEAREIPQQIDLSKYDVVMVNVNTLLRNLMSAIPSEELMSYTADEYYAVLMDEMQYLDGLFGLLDTEVKMYINDYSSAFRGVDQKNIRISKTPKQLFMDEVSDKLERYIRQMDDVLALNGELRYPPPAISGNMSVIAITHVPWDLLGFRNFKKLELLETYTGKLKARAEWGSKYYEVPDEDLSFLPLTSKLLPVFGDHVMFRPANISYRRNLLAVFRAGGVTPISTDGTISILMAKVPKENK